MMLSAMHLCPNKAGMVLGATLEPIPPGYAIHDVLLFVVQRFCLEDSHSIQERTLKADEMLDLASIIVEDLPDRHVPFGQRTFGLLARKLPCEQADELYNTLARNGCKLHANTLLQFASKFANENHYKGRAFEILKAVANSGTNLNDARPASVITSLLHRNTSQDKETPECPAFSPKKALEYFVERGLSPNVINVTALLDSLSRQSEVEESIRLALLSAECGIQLDTKTWLTVFRGAKHSLKVDNVIKALDVAKVANAPYVEVLNNLLHAIFYFAVAESRERQLRPPWTLPLFMLVLRIYVKKFDLEPLQWWFPEVLPMVLAESSSRKDDDHGHEWAFPHSVVPVADLFFTAGPQSGLRPSVTTIAIMLRCYIRSLRSPHDLVAFYGFFKSRLQEEGERGRLARELIKDQGSLIHDGFILAMTEHRHLSRQALKIFGDMLKDNMNTSADSEREARPGTSGNVPVHPRPSVMTFTILLRGLMGRSQVNLADQVVQLMDELGVKANLVTWNTLIKGHASMQNIDRTVKTLQAMEAAGFHSDDFTLRAFGRLKDQDGALKMLQSIVDGNARHAMEDGSLAGSYAG